MRRRRTMLSHDAFDLGDLLDPRPVQIACESGRGPEPPPFVAVAMPPALGRLREAFPWWRLGKEGGDVGMEARLILLDDEEVVAPSVNDELTGCTLAVQRVPGDDTPSEGQAAQDFAGDRQLDRTLTTPDPPIAPAPGRSDGCTRRLDRPRWWGSAHAGHAAPSRQSRSRPLHRRASPGSRPPAPLPGP